MRVIVCAMAKNEHKYINDWVNHYLKLGFDKIYIYDNDDPSSPYIGDFIEKKHRVEIIDIRGQAKPGLQHEVYTNFYNTHEFDWCLFCDIDEFLVGTNDIKKFLSQPIFNIYEQIRVKWNLFGDDDLIERDTSKPVMESFHKVLDSSLCWDLSRPSTLQRQAKCIVKGHLNGIRFDSAHFANRGIKLLCSCLPSGKPCNSDVSIKEDYSKETLFLNHYMTKSLSEFINQKMKRTDAVFGKRVIDMNYYWRINKRTKEKEDYLKKLGLDI